MSRPDPLSVDLDALPLQPQRCMHVLAQSYEPAPGWLYGAE